MCAATHRKTHLRWSCSRNSTSNGIRFQIRSIQSLNGQPHRMFGGFLLRLASVALHAFSRLFLRSVYTPRSYFYLLSQLRARHIRPSRHTIRLTLSFSFWIWIGLIPHVLEQNRMCQEFHSLVSPTPSLLSFLIPLSCIFSPPPHCMMRENRKNGPWRHSMLFLRMLYSSLTRTSLLNVI